MTVGSQHLNIYIYLDRLVNKEGKLRRLCVGEFPDKSPLFSILSNREFDNVTSLVYSGGTSTIVKATFNGKVVNCNYYGREYRKGKATNNVNPAVWDRNPLLRKYTFTRVDDTLKITKSSRLSTSHPSDIKDFSDMGKLLLCCDCYKILRNDNFSYDIGVENGTYKVLHYSLSGKALDDLSKMVADKWYQQNPDKANIKKSYEVIPETRATIKKNPRQPAAYFAKEPHFGQLVNFYNSIVMRNLI